MIDKAFSFFIFFIFLFFVLFQIKNQLIFQNIEKENEGKKIMAESISFNKKNFSLLSCKKVLKKNKVVFLNISADNFNPRINGLVLLTEPIICELPYFEGYTSLNYSFDDS